LNFLGFNFIKKSIPKSKSLMFFLSLASDKEVMLVTAARMEVIQLSPKVISFVASAALGCAP